MTSVEDTRPAEPVQPPEEYVHRFPDVDEDDICRRCRRIAPCLECEERAHGGQL